MATEEKGPPLKKENEAKINNTPIAMEGDSNKTIKKTILLRGGLRDRSFFSWVRILLVTALWWSFVAGFFCLCFYLMDMILYPSEESQPYFVRTWNKYPAILHQPALNIVCRENNTCHVTISRLLNWEPDIYLKDDEFQVMLTDGKQANVTQALTDLGLSGFNKTQVEELVPVICYGRKKNDARSLDGMTTSAGGFSKDTFPWTGEKDDREYITINLEKSFIVRESTEESKVATMDCVAYAKNIHRESRYVDRKIPNGGGTVKVCFRKGKIDPNYKPKDKC